jgi:hypothetical protein
MTNRGSLAPVLFLLQTAVCQAIAASVLVIMWGFSQSLGVSLACSALAGFVASHALALSPPWQLLNLILPLATASAFAVQIPAWVFLLLFVGSLLTYAPAFWTRVPYYPTHRAAYALVLAELPTDRPFTFIDIGCGMGDLLLFLSKRRPLGRFIGVEIGVLPWLIAKVKAVIRGRSTVSIRFQSMWNLDLSEYDVVYTFLSPAPMERLWAKAQSEMKAGSTFITNSFQTPEEPTYTIPVKDERQSVLYVHKMPSDP